MAKVEVKKIYQSKTFWAGLLAMVASVGLVATGEATLAEALLGAEGLIVILLRLVTDRPVSL